MMLKKLLKRKKKENKVKRQWGAEKNTTPLPMLHDKPSTRLMALSRVSIVLTVVLWSVYIFSIIIRQLIDGPGNYDFTMEAFSYAFVVTMLTFSSLMYLIARHGALQRFAKHTRVPRAILDKHFSENQPAITVLVPSYSEETDVIRKTLLSAALQEYPKLRAVLLLDDKPFPTNEDDKKRLKETRKIGKEITKLLLVPLRKSKKALSDFNKSKSKAKYATKNEINKLSKQYKWSSAWLRKQEKSEKVDDHVDVFFKEQVFGKLANDLELVSKALDISLTDGAKITKARVTQMYQRLIWIFSAELEVFERKRYASLSHEANKAMNLNAYIGLMGGTYKKKETPDGDILVPATKRSKNTINIPDTEFLLTLDADSILLQEYCLRLVYFLQQPNNAHVAVTQTPYSSFRGAYTRIERLAGATTDIQHILHQGMSKYGATFWVGANAVIRKKAIEDIVESEWNGGFEVKRYIQDRTVIEDTESSIDLTFNGWQLVNYPERLSYSATPPDFGSLVVQRRRWANGGLLILPKFIEQIRDRKRRNEKTSAVEAMLRINYMASIAWATFGLIFLLAYPYDGRLLSPLVLLAALPYFLTMAHDLRYCGYNARDVLEIYGFNLIMLPVNLAGVLKSIEQAITGKKIPFARTPKVKDRTPAQAIYVLTPLLIVGFSLFTVWRNVLISNWGNAAFALLNATLASWAILSYIGIRNIFYDSWIGLKEWLYVEDKRSNKNDNQNNLPSIDWRAVLYHGESKGKVPHTKIDDLAKL